MNMEETKVNQAEHRKEKKDQAGFWSSVLMTIGPMGLWTILFFVFPFIYIILVSFCTRDQFGNVVYDFSLAGYQMLTRQMYFTVIYQTIIRSAIVTFFVILLAYPYAYLASQANKKIQSMMMIIIMVPFWTSSLLRVYAIMNITSKNGMINSLLMYAGIIKEPLQILYTDAAVNFGMIYCALPMMVMPLYTSLQKLDPSVLEAGRDLGANSFELFLKVIFPLSIPGIMGGVVLVFIPSMFNFIVVDALGGGKLIIIGNVISNQFSTTRNWPFGAALSVVIMILSTVIIYLNNRLSMKAER